MRAGDYKRNVSFESPPSAGTTDAAGEPVKTWTPFLSNVLVAIAPLFGRELLAAQQKHNTVSHKISMRYIAGINATMRVKFVTPDAGTRYFNILSVYNEAEDNRYMYLYAEEGLVNG